MTSLESAVVLAEDKKYYPEAHEVYPEAETLVQDEDTQPLSKPIIAPIKTKTFSNLEAAVPETKVCGCRQPPAGWPWLAGQCGKLQVSSPNPVASQLHALTRGRALLCPAALSVPLQYAPAFMTGMLSSPALLRNVAIAGHLHHGKTCFMDRLIESTHAEVRRSRAAVAAAAVSSGSGDGSPSAAQHHAASLPVIP